MKKILSIMIVENNPDLRNTLRHAFEDRGYLTWTCPAPEIAMSIFDAIHPSIIILDIDFAEPDLLRLVDDWRRLAPATRVIVESASSNTERMREAMDHGAYAFLAKPYSLPPLFDLLENDVPPAPTASDPVKKKAA